LRAELEVASKLLKLVKRSGTLDGPIIKQLQEVFQLVNRQASLHAKGVEDDA
jgi:hypothetical protein